MIQEASGAKARGFLNLRFGTVCSPCSQVRAEALTYRAVPLPKIALITIVVFCLIPWTATARSLAQKKALARTQFDTAEKLRQELDGTPASERSRRDYAKVIAAYRKVYFITPNSSKADASIVDMAELLAEEGRAFNDPKASQESIKQYKFLMEQYPGSRYRTQAMFTVGKIYEEDLQDSDSAKKAFEDFLTAHPRHPLSQQAREAIAEIEKGPARGMQVAGKRSLTPRSENQDPSAAPSPSSDDNSKGNTVKDANADEESVEQPVQNLHGRRPLVTGIRHWSTPDYTRVVIDLDAEVPYEAGRIPSPDRIFFDLHGTKLAPELMGKAFDVDDGFLKRIRVAQYQVGLTRVVLEVPPVSEYSAFMLPNPERLIIDIHGKAATPTAGTSAAAAKIEAPAEKSQALATPPRSDRDDKPKGTAQVVADSGPVATKPEAAKPVPSFADSDVKADAQVEVKATSRPTTAPTVAKVAPRDEEGTSEQKDKPLSHRSKNTVDDEVTSAKAADEQEAAPRSGLHGKKQAPPSPAPGVIAREAKPVADGQRTLVRALGLKIGKIVVDAGHGGHDTGTIGPHGLMEKDLVLDVSLRLGKLLENKLGADVVFTRPDDTFIPLENRTAIANQAQADLFISVHANSSRDPSARGIETYYLNFTSNPDALEVAARENAVSDQSIHELQDLVKKIALKDKIDESREFASDVDHALKSGLSARGNNMRDRGVKKAPFIVLIGANMPSILAEISFLSNPKDERKLQTPEYRQKIAESLYRGVTDYVRGLSGIKMASVEGGK